jgi:hypothetical protein
MTIPQQMRACAACGASLLTQDAREYLAAAVTQRRHVCGGFCGLDGQPDLYYTVFALLTLDALAHGEGIRESQSTEQLAQWVKGVYPESRGVDRTCAELLLLRSGAISKLKARCSLGLSLLSGAPSDSYKLFLNGLLLERLFPERLNLFLFRRASALLLKRNGELDFAALGTPGGVVRLLLATACGDIAVAARMRTLLGQRRKASGGYAAAPGVPADLLATATALFAEFCGCVGSPGMDADCQPERTFADAVARDRAFVEMCWQEDGLFSAAPDQRDGDLEHTYYGLLALGCLYDRKREPAFSSL